MIVEVRPIEIKKWHGKKGQENFAQPLVLEALYDSKLGKYATGLNEEDRVRLEKITGFDLSDAYGDKPHPFWGSQAGKIKLPYRTSIFDSAVPLQEIKIKVLKASKYVANSLKEYNEGLYPDAVFVIYDEQEEAKIAASKIQIKRKANQLATKMSSDEKVNIIQILSGKSMRNQSQDFLDVEIDKLIEDDMLTFTKYAKMDSGITYIRAAILEGIHRNILTKEGNAILYMGDRIGFNIDEAVTYFSDPQNQQIKASILAKLTD
jgi:hypothetical protein